MTSNSKSHKENPWKEYEIKHSAFYGYVCTNLLMKRAFLFRDYKACPLINNFLVQFTIYCFLSSVCVHHKIIFCQFYEQLQSLSSRVANRRFTDTEKDSSMVKDQSNEKCQWALANSETSKQGRYRANKQIRE